MFPTDQAPELVGTEFKASVLQNRLLLLGTCASAGGEGGVKGVGENPRPARALGLWVGMGTAPCALYTALVGSGKPTGAGCPWSLGGQG